MVNGTQQGKQKDLLELRLFNQGQKQGKCLVTNKLETETCFQL